MNRSAFWLLLYLLLCPALARADTTLISTGAVWKFLDDGSNQGTAWREPAFNDGSWASGVAKLGFGGDGELTPLNPGPALNPHTTYYFRRSFTLSGTPAYSNLTVRLLRDDGGVVYLNGVEVFRSNMTNGVVASSTLAASSVDGATESAFFQTNLSASYLVADLNVIAVEIHQASTNSGDLGFALELTAGGDTDSDGMPDDWEMAYGLNSNSSADAALDLDGDGMSNFEEYISDTDPVDAMSVLRCQISQFSFGDVIISFATGPAASAGLQETPLFSLDLWTEVPFVFVPYIAPITHGSRFYRAWAERGPGLPRVFSANAVGYINYVLGPGTNSFAPPFDVEFSSLGFMIPAAPDGTCVYKEGVDPVQSSCFSFGSWDNPDLPVSRGERLSVVTSTPFVVTFVGDPTLGPPLFINQPASQEVAQGFSAVFGVQTLGSRPFTYQWYFERTTAILGATNPVLIVTEVRPELAGVYHVVVGNSAGITTSEVATLTVLLPSVITNQPVSTTVEEGGSFTLCAGVAGSGPTTYAWRRNGVNIPDAINSCLTITNAQISNGGSYSVVIANPVNSVLSDSAEVVVTVAQTFPGDNFAAPVPLPGASGDIGGTNTLATREAGEPDHAGKPGGKSVWFAWQAPASGIATFRTVGSTFDTLLAVYLGANVGSLTNVVSDEDRGGFLTSQAQFNAVQNIEYRIAVDGFGGSVGNFVLTWSLETNQALPVITVQPVGATVFESVNFTFNVTASGTGLSYQWFRGTNVMGGAIGSSLTLTNVRPADVGAYAVRVSNAGGRSVLSQQAVLEIGDATEVRSRDKLFDLLFNTGDGGAGGGFGARNGSAFMPASTVSGFASVAMGSFQSHVMDSLVAQSEPGEPPACGSIGGSSKWFGLTPARDGLLVIDTMGSSFDTTLAVYTGPTNVAATVDPVFFFLRLVPVACDADGAPDGRTSVAAFLAKGGTNYLVSIDGAAGAQGNIRLNWHLIEPPVWPASPLKRLARFESDLVMYAVPTNPPLGTTFRWFHDGTNIPGGTNASLIVAHTQVRHGGVYSASVRSGSLAPVNVTFGTLVAAGLNYGKTGSSLHVNFAATSGVILDRAVDFFYWRPVLVIDKPHIAKGGVVYEEPDITSKAAAYFRLRPFQ